VGKVRMGNLFSLLGRRIRRICDIMLWVGPPRGQSLGAWRRGQREDTRMMRRFGLILLLLAFVLVVTGAVAAQCRAPQRGGCDRDGDCQRPEDRISGKITAINYEAKTLVVTTADAKEVVVAANDKTVIKKGCRAIGFGDLKLRDSVNVCGEFRDRVLLAQMICVSCR